MNIFLSQLLFMIYQLKINIMCSNCLSIVNFKTLSSLYNKICPHSGMTSWNFQLEQTIEDFKIFIG